MTNADWLVATTELVSADPREMAALTRRAWWRKRLARPAQLPPPHQEWDTWMLLAGRGFGKTRTAAEWLWWEAWNDPGSFNHVVVRRSEDLDKVAFAGPSGLFRIIPPEIVAHSSRSPWKVVLTNGAEILGFSAEEPDVLRGPESHRVWTDELAAWKRLDSAWNDGVLMGNRLASARNAGRPKRVVTTTPKPVKVVIDLYNESKRGVEESGVILSTGTSYDNAENLGRGYIRVLDRMKGTRRGRQEIFAQLLTDIPGALFKYEDISDHRSWETVGDVKNRCRTIVVAVDPPGRSGEGAAEAGIVAVGLGHDKRAYVLRDESDVMSPEEWGAAAVSLYDELSADHITIEVNQGGEMCRTVLEAAGEKLWREKSRRARTVPVVMVHASRGKEIRAEPVSQLYAQGYVTHVGELAELEDQMIRFTQDYNRLRDGSPDRLDALVWAITDLLVSPEPPIEDALIAAMPRLGSWNGAYGGA